MGTTVRHDRPGILSILAMSAALAGCGATRFPMLERLSFAVPPTREVTRGAKTRLVTSWYGKAFDGQSTASGETFDSRAMTAAHRTLPFGTRLRVHNPRNGKSAVVRVNDRGPHLPGRDLDLSLAAARSLGFVSSGVAEVEVEILDPGSATGIGQASAAGH